VSQPSREGVVMRKIRLSASWARIARSVCFLTVLGGLFALGLATGVIQSASHANVDELQHAGLQMQEWRKTESYPELQEPTRGAAFISGSVLEMLDGRLSCRVATKEEARAMQRASDPSLREVRRGSLALEPGRKGLKIILRGTPQLDKFPEARAAFLRAAQTWETLIQNPITVVIEADFGPTQFGEPFEQHSLGVTRFQRDFDANAYPEIRSALIRSAGSPQEAALYNLLPEGNFPTDLGATSALIYHVAPKRALGLLPAVANPEAELGSLGAPPSIAFNSAINFDFDPSDGVRHKSIDFTAIAMHEIGHALGFFSGVGIQEAYPTAPPQTPEVLDMFRFRPGLSFEAFATAPRILSSGGEHVFFGGGMELSLSTGRADGVGGDGQQAGHWKDDYETKRYIGVMDPTLSYSSRYEITAHDLEAFDRIGYRVNPLPNPREAELSLDNGTLGLRVYENGLIVVNRVTPPAYPAKLQKLRILIPPLVNQPDASGKPITLLYATGDSTGRPPVGSQFTRIETFVPSVSPDLFLEFTIPNGPTINSGDFYIGYQAPAPSQGVSFAVDLTGSQSDRTFFSMDNGLSFGLLSAALQGRTTTAMLRAIVSVGGPAPTPTPTPAPTPTPTPGPDTVALESGKALDGYMPLYLPDGKAFETQYTIQAPVGATQLKIDLSADSDLDIYVRFGARAAIEKGAFVADFQSASDGYEESVTITPESSPALQAGVYYIMLVNYGPGPASFRIKATVTCGAPHGERAVRTGRASGEPGGRTTMPIELVAQGDESAIGCSLIFDPAVLSNPQAWPGDDAAGAALKVNTSRIAQGRLGITLALPIGRKFTAGVRQLVMVEFTIASGAAPSPTIVDFGDRPVRREALDANANAVKASFIGGEVMVGRRVVSVSAASFKVGALAAEGIVAAFGSGLATAAQLAADADPNLPGVQLPTALLGTTVRVTDSAGISRQAPLFFVSPTQVNYQVPAAAAAGLATVTVTSGDGSISVGTEVIAAVAPGLFTSNGDGVGAPVGFVLRVRSGQQSFEEIIQYDAAQRRYIPRPIDLGAESDEVYLILFGAGLRRRQAISTVSLHIGGVNAPVLFAGAQGELTGLDQINLRLPRVLAGRGEMDVSLVVDSQAAGSVRINIR
jgi:uncharacterized protein (TIGR03437 family)